MKDFFYRTWLVIKTPSCWMQPCPYSREWDGYLSRLMQDRNFDGYTTYHAHIGGVKVWVANHPYASFRMCCSDGNPLPIRPRRSTILLAMEKLLRDTISGNENATQGNGP